MMETMGLALSLLCIIHEGTFLALSFLCIIHEGTFQSEVIALH